MEIVKLGAGQLIVNPVLYSTTNESDSITGATSLGAGEDIYLDKVNRELQFKSLVAGDNVTLSGTSDSIIISLSGSGGGSGTITGGTSLGGEALYKQVSGANLQFKGLVAGTNISLTPSATGVTINNTLTGSSVTVNNGLTKSGDNIYLGGTLTGNTNIKASDASPLLTIDLSVVCC